MNVYYNEFDPLAAAWLRELIADKQIPEGLVDERDIRDIEAGDILGFTQYHFFCGIAGWPYALRLAGWPDDRPVVTASLPCQPFSQAGQQRGTEDERHLWPVFFDIFRQLGIPDAFGEQVASALGREWLAGVRADLEAAGCRLGAANLCAASVGAPHIRQRLFWVAQRLPDADAGQRRGVANGERRYFDGTQTGRFESNGQFELRGEPSGLPDSQNGRREREQDRAESPGRNQSSHVGRLVLADGARPQPAAASARYGRAAEPASGTGWLCHAEHGGRETWRPERDGTIATLPSSPAGFWSDFDILPFGDGKARRVESGTFPLVNGIPRNVVPDGNPSLSEVQATAEARVMRLRGYGNAIVPWLAAEFIRAADEASRDY